ncbi:MAG: LON peptidase substrate-binding domain-containing protein, partial [Caulobacterales bacterium]|nr:LON peptidase substrate-binding domain-containing protein [Caulobacterales bacterium]
MTPTRRRCKVSDLPIDVPVFPMDGALLLPRGFLPLNIFEPRYLTMVDDALASARMIAMVQTRPGGPAARPALQSVGCLGQISRFSETGDGRYLITLTGVCRLRIARELDTATPYRQVRADYGPFAADLTADTGPADFDRAKFLDVLRSYLAANELATEWEAIESAP